MRITLSVPEIAIIVFVMVTQIWAWTRDDYLGWLGISDRGISVLIAIIADVIFISVVGGIWIW